MEEKVAYYGEKRTLQVLLCDPVTLQKLVAREIVRAETVSGHHVYRASDVLFCAARMEPDFKRRTPRGNLERAVHRENYEPKNAKVGTYRGKAALIPPT